MRQQGTLTDWNDDRGFGFVVPADGGPRAFAHISAFPRGRRPAVGDVVSYLPGQDDQGRLRAGDVLFETRASGGASASGGRVKGAVGLAVLLLAVATVAGLSSRAGWLIPGLYLAMSGIAFALYRADKIAAEKGGRRTPENTLHLVAVLGGWPGALIAQQVLRHKTIKQPFRRIFWVTVVVNVAVVAWLLFGPGLG